MKIELYGTMGTGKSTLAKRIGDKLGIEVLEEEFLENPYLHKEGSEFKSQVWFIEQYLRQFVYTKDKESYISDSGFLAGEAFANTTLANVVDKETYLGISKQLHNLIHEDKPLLLR